MIDLGTVFVKEYVIAAVSMLVFTVTQYCGRRFKKYKKIVRCSVFSVNPEMIILNVINIKQSNVHKYDKKRLTLDELKSVLEKNWEGYEELQSEVVALPKYGHNEPIADAMANRFLSDASNVIRAKKNERGGNYILSTFVYQYNRTFARLLCATPDGRRDYEYLASGCAPSLTRKLDDITKPINSMRNIDFTVCGGGIAVLDVMLPMSANFDEEIFASLFYACDKCGCVAIQPNALSVDELIDAKKNPEKHKNLIVRICGLSAYFTALVPEVQDEIINRNFYK